MMTFKKNRLVLFLEICNWIGFAMIAPAIVHGNHSVEIDPAIFVCLVGIVYLLRMRFKDYKKEFRENNKFYPSGILLILVVFTNVVIGLICIYYTFFCNK